MKPVRLLFLAILLAACHKEAPPPPQPHLVRGTEPVLETPAKRGPNPSPTPAPPPIKNAAPGHEPATSVVGRAASLQSRRWEEAKLKSSIGISVNKAVMLYERARTRYEYVQKLRSNGVPAPVIFCLHMRESDNSFNCHLHEGSSLLHRTRFVPKGRLPAPEEPPYKWEVSAEDAIYVADRLQGPWTDLTWALDRMESYNGLGYRKLGIPSPYLWSGTSVYVSGKYVSDGHFNREAIDQQLGCVAILKRMQERGINPGF